MIAFEEHARWLLVVHTIVAVALVGATTHLVLWTRGYLRRECTRYKATRRFAYICLSLYVVSLTLGNLLYPTYKVRVRVQYLDNPSAIAADHDSRAESAATMRQRYEEARAFREGASLEDATSIEVEPRLVDHPENSRQAAKIARWFDVKEHWAALGVILAAACALILTFWNPRRHPTEIAPFVFGLAAGAAASAWIAAIVGVLTASYRAVGG